MEKLTNFPITFIAGILGPGGTERQLFYILKTLKTMECKVNLITLCKGQFWEEPIRQLGIPIQFAGKSNNNLIRLISIISIIKSIKPMIIQSQHFYTNIYAALAGDLCGITNVGAIRSNGAYEVKITGPVLGRLSLYLPQYLAANSLSGKKYAEESGISSERLRYLPNVIDTSVFKPIQRKESNEKINFLMVSNLTFPEKRVELFIKALGQLKVITKVPFSATIIGDGPLRSELQNIGCQNGVFPGILEFVGNQKHIEKYYQQSDILVLTSDREGTPNVILEAMATGLPVVATNVGGVSEIVQNGQTGFLVHPGNLSEIVERMVILCENDELREGMGKSGVNFILKNYSLDRLPSELMNFYGSINRSLSL